MSQRESLIFGLRAALAVAKYRPGAIVRVLHTKAMRRQVGPVLKAAAHQRRPYREVESDDLDRAAKSVHHEGVLVVARALETVPFGRYLNQLPENPLLVALDGVDNPHNHGAILRSAAWFGGDAVITTAQNRAVNPAAIRVAQGGAEMVKTVRTTDLPSSLRELRSRGVTVVAADQRADIKFSEMIGRRAICWVMGSERTGVSEAVLAACETRLAIPGTAELESLNVSVSAGILLSLSRLGADA